MFLLHLGYRILHVDSCLPFTSEGTHENLVQLGMRTLFLDSQQLEETRDDKVHDVAQARRGVSHK